MVAVSDVVQNKVSDGERNQEIRPDEDAIEYLVDIPPEIESKGFSFRSFSAFLGPGFLMSIAYLDPGNIESDLQSGAFARYKLLWVLLLSHAVGFLLQTLSARLGVVAGKNMAQVAREFYPKVPRIVLWLCIEVAIIGSDMQEVIGTSIAIFMLSAGRVPLIVGVLITILDTITFLFIERFGIRKLESFFAFLIAIMALSFGFEFFTAKPDAVDLIKGIFIPWCSDCGRKEFLQAISVCGAVIMPHNLFLHSGLVKSRNIDRTKKIQINQSNLFYFFDSGIALISSFLINMFVVSVFAHGLYGKTNREVYEKCKDKPMFDPKLFPMNNETIEADLYKAGIFLDCEFGTASLYIWAIGILASGQSSTMTGTYAGQFVMEGFCDIRWPKWRRVLITRLIAILPTVVTVLFASGVYSLTGMNDLLNCLQMMILPFALIPLLSFTSSQNIMFEYRNSRRFQLFVLLISSVIVAINMYFLNDYIINEFKTKWIIFLIMSVPIILYFLLVCYLVLVCLVAMDVCIVDVFRKMPWLKPNFDLSIRPLWHEGEVQRYNAT